MFSIFGGPLNLCQECLARFRELLPPTLPPWGKERDKLEARIISALVLEWRDSSQLPLKQDEWGVYCPHSLARREQEEQGIREDMLLDY